MPRRARIDIAGYLYHVIARGNERKEIFREVSDYKEFLARARRCIGETGQRCLAWALMPNHFHLLILRGKRPLSDLMRRLMSGYVTYFNRKYRRSGHLFQNRYKSILCEEEPYLLELAAYIHLNPLRAGLVRDYKALAGYRWCGHGEVLGLSGKKLLERDYLLEHFGASGKAAVRNYDDFVKERVGRDKAGKYSGGGLLRSIGGCEEASGQSEKELFDERVLGSGGFVESILKELDLKEDTKLGRDEIIKKVEKLTGVEAALIFGRSRAKEAVRARAAYCYLSRENGGVKGTELMEELRLSSGAISYLCGKGRKIVGDN